MTQRIELPPLWSAQEQALGSTGAELELELGVAFAPAESSGT
ncbi:MAG TPA: hypothetical protein VJW93_15550 [Candidatus Acidoferrales bacterium]|nr:hypothetical protein [Candidatus Acidoferrales bacterium]